MSAMSSNAQSQAADENSVRAFVSQQAAAQAAQGGVTRFEVQVGNVEPSSVLAPCRRIELFAPGSARYWGRASVGVRCAEGASWTYLVPVTVRVWGTALVAAVPLAAQSVPVAQDVREQEIELTRESASVLRDASQLQGRTLARAVAPGQALRADMLRATMAVQAGDMVRLRIVGTGFAVDASGQALNAGADGQTVRVRTELGKVVTGVARDGRRVEVPL